MKSYRGQCLIAARHLRDRNFHQTVVFIVEHNAEGAMGLVINRPSSILVAHALSKHFPELELPDCVFCGGPVEPSALFILHNNACGGCDDEAVVEGVHLGNSAETFENIIRSAAGGDYGTKFRVFCGCAGWGPGQLEGEIERGDWHLQPVTADVVFHDEPYETYGTLFQKVMEANRILPHDCPDPNLN